MALTDLTNTESHYTVHILDHYEGLGGTPPEPENSDMHVTVLHAPNMGPAGYPIEQWVATGTMTQLQQYTEDWANKLIDAIEAVANPQQWEDKQDQLFAEAQMVLQLCYAVQAHPKRHPQTVMDLAHQQYGD